MLTGEGRLTCMNVHDSLTPSVTPDVFDGDVLAMPCIAENRLVLVISAHDNLFIYSAWDQLTYHHYHDLLQTTT